ncbi:glycine cleavage T C-terminal barrel domain-containing protein [Curtobacterium flaccumfaciens]|nr:glycine cleavage T C-terminal barrel domain-containing protein [Curtobacterium flaccumfaciens]
MLVGLVTEGRRAPRAGYDVVLDGAVVGTVTSGALSPTLGHPVAMAFVDPAALAAASDGAQVLHIDVRGTAVPSTVSAFPFYRRASKG